MKLYRGLPSAGAFPGCVATLGVFDGVHLGHQALVRAMLADSTARGLPGVVITFEPNPRQYFGDRAQVRLTSLREKLTCLKALGVEHVWLLPFQKPLASMSAAAFGEDVLQKGLGVQSLWVGEDFRYGAGRTGDLTTLAEHGFAVSTIPTIGRAGRKIGSTGVRDALLAGDLEGASELLGGAYRMGGRVFRGDGLGRQWGVPTANIALGRHRSPPFSGIFAVRVDGLAKPYYGAGYIGLRPAIHSGTGWRFEVHLFDFDEDIYGQTLEVTFLKKLRDDASFSDLDALVVQIKKDLAMARAAIEQVQHGRDKNPV